MRLSTMAATLSFVHENWLSEVIERSDGSLIHSRSGLLGVQLVHFLIELSKHNLKSENAGSCDSSTRTVVMGETFFRQRLNQIDYLTFLSLTVRFGCWK